MDQNIDSTIKTLEETKKKAKNGVDYWRAREIQLILAYSDWRNFENAINKGRMACESSGFDPSIHFVETTKKVQIGSGAVVIQKDYFLTRYACYLIAMNGDATKPEIGTAQSYFAYQTHRQELQDKLTAEERRILLRERVRNANKKLNSAAKQAGVQKYGVFQDYGYRGLYDMGHADIKRKKKIPNNEILLDRAGRVELAANEFRITQTEEKLVRDSINGEKQAFDTHFKVGREVRNTIGRIGGKMPEDLPPEEHIKKLINNRKKKAKVLSKEKLQIE